MSDNYRAEPVYRSGRLRPLDRHPSDTGRYTHHQSHLPPHAYEPPPRPPVPADAGDVARILGLDGRHLTDDILAAVTPLLGELDRLREHADRAEHRAAWMERQSDSHPVVPCLTRRAFLRELDAYLAGDGDGIVALVSVGGMEALRRREGLAAADAGLYHAATAMIGALRASDLIACLGGADFALLLVGAAADTVHAEVAEIAGRIQDQSLVWEGREQVLMPAWGIAVIDGTAGAQELIDSADLDLRAVHAATI